MFGIKKYFMVLFLIYIIHNGLFSSNKIPLILQGEKTIFKMIAKTMNNELPDNIEILVYHLVIINDSTNNEKALNKRFTNVLKEEESYYKYTIKFEEDLTQDNVGVDLSFFNRYDELELINLGKYLNYDAVLTGTITIFDDKYRLSWNTRLKKFIKAKIALLQGNIFNTQTNISMLRLAYYFYME